ncbi:SURF1 family protein [Ancylobacter sp. Lp-2]|uniref:SURF1 family protein n=1 Tax=Ancylobacter sp. Lp-2 TaxID=2881339 RepID=UPI001E58437A|nr:SURF1 family protein [Ancylobacter sp. Lp-2]MCB4771342.1 SURF1 family protein [Ancylobacter sp. Lp-2]
MAGLFAALGVWQVKRLSWKLDLIERVEARLNAAPVAAPAPEAFSPADEYRRVRLDGHFLNDRETLVQAVTELGGGFWVLTPLATDAGLTVLVNRGFVPPERRDPASRAAGLIEGPASVVGLLRLTEPGGGFLRHNDPGGDRWYSRDVAAIAAARGLDRLVVVAPYFVDADATPVPGGAPVGGLTVVRFANNHLVYALTWFALAGMCVAAAVFLWRRPARTRGTPAP